MICRSVFSEDRVTTFLAENNRILTGRRRSGVPALLDEVESEIRRSDTDASILRIKNGDPFPETVESDYLIIEGVLDFPDWEDAVSGATRNPVEVIYGLELCHQVPACARTKIIPRT